MSSGQRITEVLDVPVTIEDKPNAVPLTRDMDGSVEFKNVTFGYRKNQPVLKNVSFRVNPGETVALVGPTGSGKSSCMSLVHRFYDVIDGSVTVGGHDVRDVTQDLLGAQVAMVLQELLLFTGSVLENIRYNSESATREQIIDAAKAVGAHDFISSLAEGYDTKLEQRGGNLSLGQRQLISFARALVADAKILVLDEATANIDSYTEMLIQKALEAPAGRPHRPRHRPPPRHHPRRRPHHRVAERRTARKRQPRRADEEARPLFPPLHHELLQLRRPPENAEDAAATVVGKATGQYATMPLAPQGEGSEAWRLAA